MKIPGNVYRDIRHDLSLMAINRDVSPSTESISSCDDTLSLASDTSEYNQGPVHCFTLFRPILYTEYGYDGGATAPKLNGSENGPCVGDESTKQMPHLFTIVENRMFPNYKFFYNKDTSGIDPPKFCALGVALTEEIMMEISLPMEVIPVDRFLLKVTDEQIDLDTVYYCMRLPLKHKIDSKRYRAAYDTQTKKLYLQMRFKGE